VKRGAGTVLVVAVGGLAAGCTVGNGAGKAEGVIFEYGCIHDPSGLDVPTMYKLGGDQGPVFFAGVPTEDLLMGSNAMHTNEMHIRMQNNGLAIQYADTLYFDVLNSYEVARCVRGAIMNGQPQYNVTEPLPGGGSTVWCDWSGTAFTDGGALDAGGITPGGPDAGASLDGGMSVMATSPRIRLTPYTDVRSSFAALSTCGITHITGVAFDGWISFEHFGSAEQPDKSPADRTPVVSDFVIQYGERMRASFHIVLGDQVVIVAQQENQPPPRASEIGGTLDGYFDFNLERGRSAQPFP
jgi:hypothetical protein